MSKRLVFNSGLGEQKELSITPNRQEVFVVGRRAGSDVCFPNEMRLSSEHAQIITDGNGVFIVDMKSRNGTFVNGTMLQPGTPHPLKENDEIYFGSRSIVKAGFANQNRSGASTTSDLSQLFAKKPVLVVGRSPECDVVVDHTSVSRKHLEISKHASKTDVYYVRDLGSLNGTFVNGDRISGTKKVQVNDLIFIGRFQIQLQGKAKDLSKEAAIRAVDIVKRFANGKIGLHESSFDIRVNSLTAIMGPSGCGKSTLLKALNGDSPASSGKVFISGLNLHENYNYLKTQIGYVPQDDIVHKELTVEQSIWYAAHLKLSGASETDIQAKIQQVMAELKIAEIKDNPIHKISGGQRKRVCIAIEILTDPLILFLDEPTSPLDPQTIEEFLKILQKLAAKGTAVVMVTHKPEDLSYMDEVVFMAEGGYMVFQGEVENYLSHFTAKNTVEVYSKLVSPKSKEWVAKYQSNPNAFPAAASDKGKTNSKQRTDTLSQFFWLTRRYLNIKLNDRVNTGILLCQAPLIALLIRWIFDDIGPGVPFLMVLTSIWFGTTNAAREIVSETAIFKRERMFNQGIWPYLGSKIAVLTLLSTIQTFVFVSIIFISYSNNSPSWNNPIESFFVLNLISLASTGFGLFLSALMNSAEKVMAVVPLTLIPQIMLAGLITKIGNASIEFMSYFTISRWGNEIVNLVQEEVVVESSMLDSNGNTINSTQTVAVQDYLKGQYFTEYPNIFGEYAFTMRLDFLFLILMFFAFLSITYLILKKKDPIRIN